MNRNEILALRSFAIENRRTQIDSVYSAIIKLEMMGLTPKNGMVECPVPNGIHPFRWNAMVNWLFNNQGVIV